MKKQATATTASHEKAATLIVAELTAHETDGWENEKFPPISIHGPLGTAVLVLQSHYPPDFHLPLEGEKLWIRLLQICTAQDHDFFNALICLVEFQAWVVGHFGLRAPTLGIRGLTKTEQSVLAKVTQTPQTGDDIASQLDMDPNAARRHLAQLVKRGIIINGSRNGSKGYYLPQV